MIRFKARKAPERDAIQVMVQMAQRKQELLVEMDLADMCDDEIALAACSSRLSVKDSERLWR